MNPQKVNYIRTHEGRYINHIVEFDQEITRDFAKEYVVSMKYWGYHPLGYGGHLTVNGSKLIWTHYDSCD